MAAAQPVSVSSSPDNKIGSEDLCCRCHKQRYFLKMTVCGHVFCKECLEPNTINLSQQNLICPMCHTFGTSTWNIQGAADGFSVNDLSLTISRDMAETIKGNDDESLQCQTCKVKVRGSHSYVCMQCKVILCSNTLCLGDHIVRNHYLVLRICSLDRQPTDSQTCLEHAQDLHHFCNTCKKVLCASCLESDTHHHHKVECLSQSAERARTHLKTALAHLEPSICYLEWFYKDVRKAGQDISRERQKVENQIHTRAQEARNLIQDAENAAVSSLVKLTMELEHQRYQDEIKVNDKLCGLRAKRDHLTSTLSIGTDRKLIHMETNALDMIQNRSVLKQFTSKPPDNVQLPCDHNDDSTTAALSTAIEKYIGCPHVQKSRRKAPAINIMFQYHVKASGSPETHTWRVCSGGRNLLVWVSSSSLSYAHGEVNVQLVDMSNFTVHSQTELKEFAGARVDLVNADQHSAIINGRQQFMRLLKNNTELFDRKHNAPFTVFCKGSLRTCLRFSGYRHEILPCVNTLEDMWGDVDGFDIIRNGMPVNMDSNESGQLFAVINNFRQLMLYRRGEATPYATYPSTRSGSSSAKILDACFFKIENQEVLLLANETENDVIALDVHRGCRLVGTLTNRSGELSHPVALNVDPYTGRLLVLSSPGTDGKACLSMCGPTGMPLESRLEYILGKFGSKMKT